MLRVKYAGKKVSRMDGSELVTHSKALLLKIHAITGWTIPEAELRKILVDQFQKTLVEKYGDMNTDEIEYAFRKNTGVEDWGKAMNLNLIDKVLTGYLNERRELSEREEKTKADETFDLKTSINWRKQIQENYEYFIYQGKFFKPHPFEYDQLEQDGFIQNEAWKYRARIYRDRLLKFDEPFEQVAKERTVLQLFRTARKLGYVNLYK